MIIPPLQSKIEASDVPMERLAANSALSESEKIAEAARQFEAVLLRQILESTQKSVFQSKYTDNSTASGIYRDMITNQLADSISKSGSVGLAQVLHKEFTRQLAAEKEQNPEAEPPKPLCTSPKQIEIFSTTPTKARDAKL